MKKRIPPLVVIEPDNSFERVEIFLRAKGRLPTEKGGKLTQEILDEFCKKYEAGELKEGMVNLKYLYDNIKKGVYKLV